MGILRTDKISGLETPTAVTGSVVFDGSGDYLTTSSADSFNPRINLFTIEFFTYPNSTDMVAWVESGTDRNFYIETYLTTGIYVGDGTINNINVAAPPISKWTHIALAFDGTTYRLFYDGILQGSSTTLLANNTLSSFRIGATYNGSRPFNGYISNLRILKGTALYTANFTPPSHELEKIGDTVLLCCNNPDSAGAEATGKAITVNGNAAASTVSPGLTRDFIYGTQFEGVSRFDTQGYFVPPSGTTEQRFLDDFSGVPADNARGLWAGGVPSNNIIDYVTISSTGNAIDFGDLTVARFTLAGCASAIRGLFGGGYNPTQLNVIDYVEIATTGNAQDFGDLTTTPRFVSALSDSTRGLWAGGYVAPTRINTINYVTISSTGNASDFGDLTQSLSAIGACSSPTRGLFGGGSSPTVVNTISYVTIQSFGNSTDFGDLTVARSALSACSSTTRGVFAGGWDPTILNTIDYVTIASTGNAFDFGDLTVARTGSAACSSTRGLFGGGYSTPTNSNVIDYVTIGSLGNAVDFGDLTVDRRYSGACSNGHGGLG